MDAHRGQLFVEGNRHGLEASITIDGKHCVVVHKSDTWTFRLHDVTARRWQGNDFKLTLAGEPFVFTAEDPIRFTFEVVDQMDSGGSRRRSRSVRRPRVATTPRTRRPRTYPMPDTPPAEADPRSAIWTDLAGGREASSLLEALADINKGDAHTHRWEAEDRGSGVVQICAECRQVFIDLIEAEQDAPADIWTDLR